MMDITKPNSFEPSAVGAKIRWRVCCSALLIFALLQLMVGWQRGKGQNPICNAAVEYPPWVESVNVFISSAFIVTALNQVVRINVSTFNTREDFDTLLNFYASFCVNIIAGSATLLTYIFDWGGTCVSVDRFVPFNIVNCFLTQKYNRFFSYFAVCQCPRVSFQSG